MDRIGNEPLVYFLLVNAAVLKGYMRKVNSLFICKGCSQQGRTFLHGPLKSTVFIKEKRQNLASATRNAN
jgi:hypothetical protein